MSDDPILRLDDGSVPSRPQDRDQEAMERHNDIVTVIAWHGSMALVRFEDGWIALTPGRCLRKVNRD